MRLSELVIGLMGYFVRGVTHSGIFSGGPYERVAASMGCSNHPVSDTTKLIPSGLLLSTVVMILSTWSVTSLAANCIVDQYNIGAPAPVNSLQCTSNDIS